MNREQFAEVWTFLTAGVSTAKIPTGTDGVYYEMLKGIDFNTGREAAKLLLARTKTRALPAVGKILSAVVEIMDPEIPNVEESWEEACSAIEKYGYYQKAQTLSAVHPVTRRTVERIGFEFICHWRNQNSVKNEFRKAFRSVVQKHREELLLQTGEGRNVG